MKSRSLRRRWNFIAERVVMAAEVVLRAVKQARIFVLACEDMILRKLLAGRIVDLVDAAALWLSAIISAGTETPSS